MTHLAEGPTTTSADAAARLAETCRGYVHLPGDPGYDAGRTPWNVAAQLRPVAVAAPRTVTETARVVREAAALGLRVAPQATGHAAGPLAAHRLDDVVLVRTALLDGVYVDPDRRIARVEAGATWEQVVDAAAPYGLTALHGSAPDVGVVGYTLGGGLSWYARKHGLAAGTIRAAEVVDASGEVVRTDATCRPDLLWALRGGGGSFGVVTMLEIGLLPIADAVAGMMLWDIAHAETVVRTWADWCAAAPEEVTTSLRLMRFPPTPELPDFLRGRAVVIVDGAALLDDDRAAEVLAPLRNLGPELDTFARVPSASLVRLHMDPEQPTPSEGGGLVLDRLDEDAVSAFLAAAGAASPTQLLLAELRHIGGAVARTGSDEGALPGLPGSHVLLLVGVAASPEMAAAARADVERVLGALAPWSNGRQFLNLAERPVDPSTGYGPEAWTRLCTVRADVDPHGVFLANHVVPPTRP